MRRNGKLLVNLTRGSVICDHVEIADRARRRMRGLIGRSCLPAGDGMLLQPAPSIHTAFMRFPIDVVFTDGTLRVTKIVEELRPWRLATSRHAKVVVELATGEVQRRGIDVGDQLGLVTVTDDLAGTVTPSGVGQTWPAEPFELGADDQLDPGSAVQREVAGNGRSGSRPGSVRVLLVGTDRRFRSVAAVLLTRRGCVVRLTDRSANVARIVRRERVDVVVLDAGVSLTEAAHRAAEIEAVDPRLGIVLVGEDADERLTAMPVLAKWGSFDRLFAAITQSAPSGPRRVSDGSG